VNINPYLTDEQLARIILEKGPTPHLADVSAGQAFERLPEQIQRDLVSVGRNVVTAIEDTFSDHTHVALSAFQSMSQEKRLEVLKRFCRDCGTALEEQPGGVCDCLSDR
jgi:hypothetical protein